MKGSYFIIVLLLMFLIVPLSLSAENAPNSSNGSNQSSGVSKDKISKGFDCLENLIKDCKGLTTQELALTILATPDKKIEECVSELESRKKSDNWGNIRDTALAILALHHVGKKTIESEDWLLNHTLSPSNLIWFIEEDSKGDTECKIKYDSNDYNVVVGENKKINKNAGQCLELTQSEYWFKVLPKCYGKEFEIGCDKDFIISLLYKNKDSDTLYVLDNAISESASKSVKVKINSRCFGSSSTCEFEGSLWATFALLQTGHDIRRFVPYLIAMSETNEKYLPDAFIYLITNKDDYASKLMTSQKSGNYWLADKSAYNKYYDTALAVISLGGNKQTDKSKDWLLFSQGSNGCWRNSVRDSAIILWALANKPAKITGGSKVTFCKDAGFFCIPRAECPEEQNVGNNYFCPSQSTTCCKTENLKTCSNYSGVICSAGEVCEGSERKSLDSDSCCIGKCKKEEKVEETECESKGYYCQESCRSDQEEISYACDGENVCCQEKTKPNKGGLGWLVWLLVIAILVVLGIIAWIYRDKLKLEWFKFKSRFKKEGGSPSQGAGPRMPPRPPAGMPIRRRPLQRMPARKPLPVRRTAPKRIPAKKAEPEEDVFKKLREMSR